MNNCYGCGKGKDVSKVAIESVRHNHHTAHKVQKRIKAVTSFVDVKTGEPAPLCGACQKLVLSGMNNGGNWA